MTLQYSPLVKPIDKCVELYNSLFLTIRENKNTLTKWISNIYDKCEENVRLIVHNEKKIDKVGDCLEHLEERVDDIEAQLQELKEHLIIEIREDLLREVREEMRS